MPELGQAAADRLGARFVPIDVTDDGSVRRAAADIEEHEGRVDTLINNAGIIGSHGRRVRADRRGRAAGVRRRT